MEDSESVHRAYHVTMLNVIGAELSPPGVGKACLKLWYQV